METKKVEIKRFKVSEDVLAEVLKYLTSRPYQEVSVLVMALQKDLEFFQVEELERPIQVNQSPITEPEVVDEEPEEKSKKTKKK